MTDYFRVCERNLFPLRRNDSIPSGTHGFNGMEHFHIFLFHLCHFFHHGNQVVLSGNLLPDQFAEHPVVTCILHFQYHPDSAVCHTDTVHLTAFDIFAADFNRVIQCIPYRIQILYKTADALYNISLEGMGNGQHFHPFGQIKLNHGKRKLIQDIFQNMINITFLQLFTVDRKYGNAVLFREFQRQFLCFFGIWLFRIQQNNKRLFQLFQFPDRSLFRFYVVFSGQFTKAAIRCDNYTYAH